MRKVIVAFVCSIATLAAIEACVRATYDERWFASPPFEKGQWPKVNRDHLRDEDYGAKRPGTYRILLLGDSFTFGSGVTDDAAVWPAIVEKRINETRPIPGVERYEVLNGGLPGSLTDQWVQLYRQQAPSFQPDLVVAVFFLRDGTRVVPEMMVQRVRSAAARGWDWGFEHWYTYRWLRERQATVALAGEFVGYFVESYTGSPDQTEEWRRAQANLLQVQSMARAEGRRFGVVGFPMLFALDRTPYPFAPVLEAVEKFCARNHIPYASLLPALAGQRAETLWVAVGNQHPNARGHELAAEGVLAFLLSLVQP